ncbi:MAG: pirin family protein [Acidobacteriota bacterium]|nr:MAG: pirin family protein [Acidobacteriota bacterium]
MIKVRKAEERGHANYGWLDTSYTFSFNTYYDPEYMGFRSLRVINEDYVEPGQGFGTHGHKDMEIITYVMEGALAHKDSSGGSEVLKPHEVQRMTAGSGIRHSEFNPSDEERVHLYQIWILPEANDLEPGYEQTYFAPEEKKGRLRLVASKGGDDGSVKINQDVSLYASILGEGESVTHAFSEGRHGWIQVVKGSVEVNGTTLDASDGAAISGEDRIEIVSAAGESEILLFDLN